MMNYDYLLPFVALSSYIFLVILSKPMNTGLVLVQCDVNVLKQKLLKLLQIFKEQWGKKGDVE